MRANTRLRSLTFSMLSFDGDHVPYHTLACLRTLPRGSLEELTFTQPVFMNTAALKSFFEELDGLLNDEAIFSRLRSVRFYQLPKESRWQPKDLDADLKKWFPRLCERGLIFLKEQKEGGLLA